MRNLALADLTDDGLEAMLVENETLFVEHKTSISDGGFLVAKAMCSFANMLGGWVLIGVTNGEPNAGLPTGWEPVPAAQLTDRVREALAHNRVDPLPPFAATVREVRGKPVGIVRVYESADAPHVLRGGQIVVRSIAQDQNVARPYRPGGVETQAVLADLVARGRRGEANADELLEDGRGPFLLRMLRFRDMAPPFILPPGTVALRAAPITATRLRDWAVSKDGMDALERVAADFDGFSSDARTSPTLDISGLAAECAGTVVLETIDLRRHGIATVAADCAGLVGASLLFGEEQPALEPVRVTLNGFRDLFLVPLLKSVCELLDAAELYGRSMLRIMIGDMQQTALIDDRLGIATVPRLPIGGEISLPLSPDRGELDALADRWRADVGRAVKYPELR